jgi:hypothetical protein
VATAPVVPSLVSKEISWLKHHLILTGVLILSLYGGVYGVFSLIDKHDKARDTQNAAALQLVVSQVKVLQDNMAAHDAAADARAAQLQTIIQQQNATIAATNKALQGQLEKNATLTAQQAAARLVEQYKADAKQAQASGDNVLVDLPLTRQIVSTFDQNVACQANLVATGKQLDAVTTINKDLTQKVTDRDGVIKGKDEELGKQKTFYEGRITTLTNDARKGKLKWFGIGFAAGYVYAKAQHVFGF